MNKNIDFTIEELYVLLQNKSWDKLLMYEKTNRKIVTQDIQIRNIFENFFFPEYIKYLDQLNNKLDAIVEAKQLYKHFIQLHNTSIYNFNETFRNFVEKLLEILKSADNLEMAYNYARNWKELNIAKEIIFEYEKKEVKNTQHEVISIKKYENSSKEKCTIKLFKSKQEFNFFTAVIQTHQNFFTYPNVALSCLIDFEKIKDELSSAEKDYFFKAIVDCVVFNVKDNNYEPINFYELDSDYHDNVRVINNDRMKTKIFEVSGLKLIRIRPKNNESPNIEQFIKAIEDIKKDEKG
ncbi:hypothetical protein ACOL23_09525 [Aliarcobacter butzleri]